MTEKGHLLYDSINQASKVVTDKKLEQSIIDTNNLTDGPAKVDLLSRIALAKYLAKRLRYIYKRDIDKGKYGSFFMHIDGAWGSGKSTLLGFLEEELKTNARSNPKSRTENLSDGKWVIVNFNAWENQRLDPPWWFLMKTIYNEAIKSLKSNFNKKGHPDYSEQDNKRIRRLIWSEYIWRIKSGKSYLLVAGITFILLIFSLGLGAFNKAKFDELPIVQLLTLIGFLWSLAKAFGSGLALGTAKAAQKFIEENGKDPLQIISEHFKDQINIIGYPVAIFIDDLDRCNIEYGIRLLEGLQTIFKKAGVVYVIAADRKWLSTMYEHQYEKFATVIEKPSKPFGMVFLDKIFQLIVELPDISSVQKKIYWDNLLNINVAIEAEAMDTERKAVQIKVKVARSNANKMEIANDQTSSPQLQQMTREEVLGALSIQEEERILEHKLQHFIDLIEPNPRAMKRLINDISTARAIAFLYNQEVDENQLILWTILKLQHPLLAEYFWNNPQKMDQVLDYVNLEKPFSGNKDFDNLFADPNEKKLFQYRIGDKNIILNKEFIFKLKFQSACLILSYFGWSNFNEVHTLSATLLGKFNRDVQRIELSQVLS